MKTSAPSILPHAQRTRRRQILPASSKKEQKRRFLERLKTPDKNWKFSAADIKERGFWDAYQEAYEEAIRSTATVYAPWYVVPADNIWFTSVVSQAPVDELKAMNWSIPS